MHYWLISAWPVVVSRPSVTHSPKTHTSSTQLSENQSATGLGSRSASSALVFGRLELHQVRSEFQLVPFRSLHWLLRLCLPFLHRQLSELLLVFCLGTHLRLALFPVLNYQFLFLPLLWSHELHAQLHHFIVDLTGSVVQHHEVIADECKELSVHVNITERFNQFNHFALRL